MVLAFFTLASAALIFWLFYSMREVRSEARSRFFEQYNRQQLLLAEQASRTLEELFETFHQNLTLVTGLFREEEVNTARVAEVSDVLAGIFESLKNAPVFDMAIFDEKGTVIGSYPPSPGTIGVNLGWRDYFAWAKYEGRPGMMHVTRFLTMAAGKVRGQKALIALQGIYGPDGRFKGLAIITLNFDEMAKKYVLPVRIGKNGYAWLVDAKNGVALVDPRNRLTAKPLEEAFLPKWPRLYSLLKNADLNRPETGWYEYEDPEDETKTVRKLVGYSPVHIGDHRWILGVATPEYEIESLLGSFLKRQENFTLSVAFSIFFGSLAAFGLLVAWNGMLARRVALRTRDLARARAELVAAEKLAAVGHMALGLTHEIRNPLSAIRMNVQMIRQESPDNSLLQENFSIIEEEIRRLNKLLGDVMDFARPKPLTLKETDLRKIAERVASLMAVQLSGKNIRIAVTGEGEAAVTCDPEQMNQVVLNLVINSMEALGEGPGSITIELKRSGDFAILRVTDDGPGMPEELRSMIFNPFFTTKAGGGGLGLATVQSIVHRHGGTVEARNAETRGAVITVRMPVGGPAVNGEAHS